MRGRRGNRTGRRHDGLACEVVGIGPFDGLGLGSERMLEHLVDVRDRNDLQAFLHVRRYLGEILLVLLGNEHRLDAAAQRGEQLFLESADREHPAAKGDEVRLVGFGTFSVAKRKASTGRNPRTGEPMTIKASTQPKFKAGKGLKDSVN